jgi:hypothetical protein
MRKRDSVIHIVNDDDSDDVLADGESIRTPLYLTDTVQLTDDGPRFVRNEAARDARAVMDMAGHRPGYVALTDDQIAKRLEARDAMIRRAENAWRTPRPNRDGAEPDMGTSPDELAMHRHMYGAPGLPTASDPDVDSAMTMRGHMGELFERSQRQRDRAWGSYKDQLTNAWRGGRTDPRRAAQVEGLQERWRHGRDGATE